METSDQPRILVVDDEHKMVKMVADYLEAVGYHVFTAENGKDAISIFNEKKPDLLVLDVMMPGIDGLDTARRIRKDSHVPIIMLTARAEEQDKLMGLDVGADDYVVKPFSLKELAARIRAVLRRSKGSYAAVPKEEEEVLRFRDLVLDRSRRTVHRAGERVHVTGAQFELMSHMMRNPERVFTRMQLLELLQDQAYEGYERTIDVHIKNIRKAIEPDPSHPIYLQTVWGVGYKMEDEGDGATV